MGRIEKTIFISYRRTNVPWALAIYQNLTMHGYDVFFDYQSIDSGNFEKVILENIKSRAHFLVILTPSALERCKEPGDWFRREIETAMDEKRNIVPLMLESFDFGSPLVKEALTGKLAALNTFNGLRVYSEYFFEAMDKLRERYMNVEVKATTALLLNAEATRITETQKTAASSAAPVEKEELTAQEWFERGYVFQEANNLAEAVRCYAEAIRLKPDYAAAYNNRGNVRRANNDLQGALTDYDEAIRLKPDYAEAYNNRGNVRGDNNYLQGALADFAEAIRFKPEEAAAYNNRGVVRGNNNDLQGALADFAEAIRIKPDYAEAYANMGNLLKDLRRYVEAEAAYRKAIEFNPLLIQAYINLVVLLRLINRVEDAIPLLEKMIKINREDFNAYLAISSINKQMGRGVSNNYIEKVRQLMQEDDWYNRACLESVCDNLDTAFDYLQKAAQYERFDRTWAWEDPDLQWIRNDPRFTKIVGPKPE